MQSYTQLKIDKQYIILDTERYITVRTQKLNTCKKIGYKYYCKELFVVKSKTRYSCASAIYFKLDPIIIKENCKFLFYYNKTDVNPAMLDCRQQIILANWPSYKKIMCVHNNNIPINIPSHQYVLLNRSMLCNCDLEAESNFLLESLAACKNSKNEADLTMYFTEDLAFVNYLEGAVENLCSEVLTNWTTQEQVLPLSIDSFDFDPKLLYAPQTMKDFITQYKYRKEITDKQNQKEIEKNPDRFKIRDIPQQFYSGHASLHSSIDYISCYFSGDVYGVWTIKIKGFSSKYSITEHTKAVEAADSPTRYCIHEPNWYIMGLLLMMLLGITYLVMCKVRKSCLFKGCLFSNKTKIVLICI